MNTAEALQLMIAGRKMRRRAWKDLEPYRRCFIRMELMQKYGGICKDSVLDLRLHLDDKSAADWEEYEEEEQEC